MYGETRVVVTGDVNIGITNIVNGETPVGVIDGVNGYFQIAQTPSSQPRVFLNGIRQKYNDDITISSNIINFISPPIPGDIILVDYNY